MKVAEHEKCNVKEEYLSTCSINNCLDDIGKEQDLNWDPVLALKLSFLFTFAI